MSRYNPDDEDALALVLVFLVVVFLVVVNALAVFDGWEMKGPIP